MISWKGLTVILTSGELGRVRLSGKDLKLYSCMIIILPLEVKHVTSCHLIWMTQEIWHSLRILKEARLCFDKILPSLNYPFTSLEIAPTVVLHEAWQRHTGRFIPSFGTWNTWRHRGAHARVQWTQIHQLHGTSHSEYKCMDFGGEHRHYV